MSEHDDRQRDEAWGRGADLKAEAEANKPEIRYVNAYAVSRLYGGPEEGGWWYDFGHFLDGVPFRPDIEGAEERAKEMLREVWEPEYPPNPHNRQGRFSVNGGDDLELCVEDERGKDYPETRPHYE